MELLFLALLVVIMIWALGSGFPVAFSLPGAAIITIALAAGSGYLFEGNPDAYFAQGGPYQWLSAGVTNFRGIYWEPERDTLIAIPLFVFMGIMLQRSKIAEDLLVAMAQLFGPVPGGLGISVVFVGALLAATTGIVGATVVAMGLISLPAMLRNNYSPSLATGTIAASGTLGQIIPPSIVLIILADQLASAADQAENARKALYKVSTGELIMPSEYSVSSTSAGEMFLGAFLPGLVLVALYMIYILVYAFFIPKAAPAVPYDGKYDRAFFGRVAMTLIPPLALIFAVLGSIIMGIATVNQAGAIGAVGAMIMAGYRLHTGSDGTRYIPAVLTLGGLVAIGVLLSNYTINVKNVQTAEDSFALTAAVIAVAITLVGVAWSGWRTFRIDKTLEGVMIETAKTTSLVFIILLGAAMLTSAFRAFGGEELVKEFLTSLPGGFWFQFFIVMAVIFLLGFFLDFIEIAVVVVPIVAPILLADPGANVTAVWLGVMIGLNIQTSFLTPPFGFALFYLRGVAPATVRTVSMYKGVVVFICLQLLALGIVGYYPPLVNYLPNRLSLTGETAPPPINPRLQSCLEEYKFDHYATDGDTIRAALTRAESIDLSLVPSKLAKGFTSGLNDAGDTFEWVEAVRQAIAAREAATNGYAPLHAQVRRIERDARKIEDEAEELASQVGRLNRTQSAVDTSSSEARIEHLREEAAALRATIPANWDADHKTFLELQKAETNARRTYRRGVDGAYEDMSELGLVLAGTDALKAIAPEVEGLSSQIDGMEPEAARDLVGGIGSRVGEIAGARAIRSALTKARRQLRDRRYNLENAQAELAKAVAELRAEIAWREPAQSAIGPQLLALDEAIRDTIGLRKQSQLPKHIAMDLIGCKSVHSDLSLNF